MSEIIENTNLPNTISGTSFDVSRITLTQAPDVKNIVTSQINQTLNT